MKKLRKMFRKGRTTDRKEIRKEELANADDYNIAVFNYKITKEF